MSETPEREKLVDESAQQKAQKRARRNVLVISSVERPVAALREALGGDVDELHIVVPAVHQSRLQWLTTRTTTRASGPTMPHRPSPARFSGLKVTRLVVSDIE